MEVKIGKMICPTLRTLLKANYENLNIRFFHHYHPELDVCPRLPLPIHDSDYDLFPEAGQPLNMFLPNLSDIDYDEMKSEVHININKGVLHWQHFFQRISSIDLLLISNQALVTAKEVPNKLFKNNHFLSMDGFISVEKIFPSEKLMTSLKDKLSNVTSKISEGRELPPEVLKVWESVKEKLPTWQNTIATKLQEFQNRINKGIAKKDL